jgi:hypothetical protein
LLFNGMGSYCGGKLPEMIKPRETLWKTTCLR